MRGPFLFAVLSLGHPWTQVKLETRLNAHTHTHTHTHTHGLNIFIKSSCQIKKSIDHRAALMVIDRSKCVYCIQWTSWEPRTLREGVRSTTCEVNTV